MDGFIILVWRCTSGAPLFTLLLLCGAVSFLVGGPRFFAGCWRMALTAGGYTNKKYLSGLWELRSFSHGERRAFGLRADKMPKRTNPISALLWKVLFGIWLQILFLILAAVCHFLMPCDFDYKMLKLACGARNPAYIIEG